MQRQSRRPGEPTAHTVPTGKKKRPAIVSPSRDGGRLTQWKVVRSASTNGDAIKLTQPENLKVCGACIDAARIKLALLVVELRHLLAASFRQSFASLFFFLSFSVLLLLSFSAPFSPVHSTLESHLRRLYLRSLLLLRHTRWPPAVFGHPPATPSAAVMQASHAQNLLFWRAKPTPLRGQVVMVRKNDTRQQTAMRRQPSAEARGRQRWTMGWAGSVTGRLAG